MECPDNVDGLSVNLDVITDEEISHEVKEQTVLVADVNARVGTYHDFRPSRPGQFSTGKKNDNGGRMLEMCTYHDLWITNSCFKTKLLLKVSWRQMRSEHRHQLGLILVSHDDLKNVLRPCSLHNANWNIDHSLRSCKIRLNVSKMPQLDLVEQFS